MAENETKEERKKRKAVEEKFKVFLKHYSHDVSIHGVKNAFDDTKSRTFRVCWMVLGLIAIVSLLKMLSELYIAVQEYKVQTVIKITPTDELPFPAVTICNLNGIELGKLAELNTPTMNVSGLTLNMTLEMVLFKFLRNKALYPSAFLNVPFQNISRVGFADMNNTVQACFWDGKTKLCESLFEPLDLEMGRCFQFNGRNDRKRMVSQASGLSSGLQVILDVRQEQYLVTQGYSAGFQVILHEPGEMPDIINSGFFTEPGVGVYCKVQTMKYTYLPLPFKAYGKDPCDDTQQISASHRQRTNVTVYSSALCRRMCADRFAQKICRCRLSDASAYSADNRTFITITCLNKTTSSDTLDDASIPLCTILQVYSCYIRAFDTESRKLTSSNCKCTRRCAYTAYSTSLSNTRFPSETALEQLLSATTMSTKKDQERSRKNFLSLKIYFDDLVYKDIKHVPEHTLESILGNIGGQLGLFLGASVLSMIELSYLLMTVCKRGGRIVWKKMRKKNGKGQESGTFPSMDSTEKQQEPEQIVELTNDTTGAPLESAASSEMQLPLHGSGTIPASQMTLPSDTASFESQNFESASSPQLPKPSLV